MYKFSLATKKAKSIPKLLDGRYFTIVKLENTKVEVICSICKRTRRGDLTSTGNFMDHIEKDHADFLDEVKRYRKSSVVSKKNTQKTLPQMMKKCTVEEVSLYFRIIFFRIFPSVNP